MGKANSQCFAFLPPWKDEAVQKMPKTGAYPITLFQRLQMWPLCRQAPDLGVSVDTGAGDTNEMRQLWQRAPSDYSGLLSEDRSDE